MDPNDTYFKLNQETARIGWHELARFFAQGHVLQVAQGLDLPKVAAAMADDDTDQVRTWSDRGDLITVPDQTAAAWFELKIEVWAVTVAPFILVQKVDD